MRALVKTLLLVLGIAALALLIKGFPQLRALLRVFLHPIGLVGLGLLGFWIYWLRTRSARDHTRIINNSPKRIPPPKSTHENDHTHEPPQQDLDTQGPCAKLYKKTR